MSRATPRSVSVPSASLSALRPISLSLLLAAVFASPARAQDWSHTVTPYLWGSAMSGSAAVGATEADVDMSFGDILDQLKIGGMIGYRGDSDRWTIMADAIYMNLEAQKDGATASMQINAEADIRQTALEGDVGYHLSPQTVVFAGLRYNNIDADLRVNFSGSGTSGSQQAGTDESWVDPVAGVMTEIPLDEKWSLGLRGDIGGFGIGADFAWQTMITVRWQASDTLQVVGGYRYLDVNYSEGSGPGLFKYDMATSGPGMGVSFLF